MRGESVPVIFGIKMKQYRQERELSLKAFSQLTGLSPSYLNEIEKGKKYPKSAKILQIAEAIGVPYDELVSLKLEQELDPLEMVLESPVMRELPLELFGITHQDVIRLITKAPKKIVALIRTVDEIARGYDMHVEHFFHAMLRSFQETHGNHFPEIETSAASFRESQGWPPELALGLEEISGAFAEMYGVAIDEKRIGEFEELGVFRSIWISGPPALLWLNPRLTERQKAFQIGREIGYREMALQSRGLTSSRSEVSSFEQVLNDFKASYFAGALMMGQESLVGDLNKFFALPRWDGEALLAMMEKYQVTPEMFFYRLTQIVPQVFGLRHPYFVRITHDTARNHYHVTKQLNTAGLLLPAGLGEQEHLCRRWNATRILRDLAQKPRPDPAGLPIISAQRSHCLNQGGDYFSIALGRPLALAQGSNSSVTLGFRLSPEFKKLVGFWDDPSIESVTINESCERCGLAADDCGDREAAGRLYAERIEHEQRNQLLKKILQKKPADGSTVPRATG